MLMASCTEPSQPTSSSTWLGSSLPTEEFGFADLARDYFLSIRPRWSSKRPCCWRCSNAPHYFRRAGKGRFKKAPAEHPGSKHWPLSRKRRQMLAQIDAVGGWSWPAGQCPQAPVRDQLYKILFKPRQKRAGVQGRRRSCQNRRTRHRWSCSKTWEPLPERVPVPLATFPVRATSPRGTGFPSLQRPTHH
jgi:hypothetical protein